MRKLKNQIIKLKRVEKGKEALKKKLHKNLKKKLQLSLEN